MVNSGFLNGMDNKKDSIKKMIDYLTEKGIGEGGVQYKMKDWAFNRQRYWGEPIPIIYCPKCGMVPVPYDELPLKLPNVENFEPGQDGESPLAKIDSFVNCKCPVCGGDAKRETDTMPQWAGSSWYFLRYVDPHNDKTFADYDKLKYWMPVDWYNGGMEHVTRHLIYSRFWYKFLYDLGVVPYEEPYQKRTAQGLILGPDGVKMSKSRGNKKVIFRSLDVGSDKLLPYWSAMGEENPAIGWRSIRITLDRRAILRKQVRAFLRAAAGKELNVMFPMISDVSEFEEAKETLLIELEKEKRRGTPIPSRVNVGLMIEVPSIVFQLEDVLKQADFISIGTNDLAQFTFACDRGNPRLTERYDVLSSPFLKLMGDIVAKADAAGVYCSVCGEMASNPIEAMALIGLGYRNLSASGSSYGRVKSMIRSVNAAEVSDYVKSLLKSQKRTLRPQLMAYAYDHGIEIY